jgi:thioredoxin 1
MAIVKGSESDFASLINDDVVLVDFYAEWCGPCKMLMLPLHELAEQRSNIKIVEIDIDQNENLTRQYGVLSVPTLILFKKGQLVGMRTGFMPREALEEWINEKSS